MNKTEYWNLYYKNKLAKNDPSPFVKFVVSKLNGDEKIVEVGCGNGRDCTYFARQGFDVTAVDMSDVAINMLKSQNLENINFICDDFTKFLENKENSFDCVYSRFTIHAITEKEENLLIKNAYTSLKKDGKFFIEVRGVNDELFGKGEQLERNAFFYDNHYRRFVVKDELCQKLQDLGFIIEYSEEKNGFAPFGNSDPIIIRIIAKK